MARTYRRQRAPQVRAHTLRLLCWVQGHYLTWHAVDPVSDEGRRDLARFHADQAHWSGAPPRTYRQTFVRSARQQGRLTLHRDLQAGTEEGTLPLAPHRHSARHWW